MSSKAAALHDARSFGGRQVTQGDVRRVARFILRHTATCIVAAATVGASGLAVTLGAAWLASGTQSSGAYTKRTMGPGALALVEPRPQVAVAGSTWSRGTGTPPVVWVPEQRTKTVAAPQPKVRDEGVPLPRRHPAQLDLVRAPLVETTVPPAKTAEKVEPEIDTRSEPKPHPQVAVAAPPTVASKEPVLSGDVSRTAVYDITGSIVYMPDGSRLEAHSGLGDKMDDPRHIKVRMRGPTPPNVYVLTEREALFHGVRAIRLNPVDRGRMFGRDGMLAHTYMLGPNGQSNGCVSFKDYRKFLTAFLDGKVDKLVVVDSLRGASWRTAALEAGGVPATSRRFAGGYSRPRLLNRIFGATDDDEPRYTSALGYNAERANW